MDDRPWSSMSGRGSSNSSFSSRPSSVQPKIRATTSRNSSFGGALSSQTRMILQQLEKMSTPVKDAKRMRLGERWDPEKSATPMRSGQEKVSSGRLRGPPLQAFHAPALPSPASSRISSLSSRNSEPYWNWRRVIGDDGNDGSIGLSTPVATGNHRTLNGGGKMRSKIGKATPVAPVFNADAVDLEYSDDAYSSALPLDSGSVPRPGFLSRQTGQRDYHSTEINLQPSHNFAFADPVPLASSRFSFAQPASLRQPRAGGSRNRTDAPKTQKTFSNGPSSKPVVLKVEPEEKMDEEEEEDSSFSTSSSDEESPADPSKPSSNIGLDSFRGSEKWQCSSCHFRNPVDETSCVSCLSKKNSNNKSKKEANKPAGGSEKWTCKKCTLPNSADVLNCLCCKASKDWEPPAKKKDANGSKWTCDACMISNEAAATQCVACTTPKPGSAPAKKPFDSGGWSSTAGKPASDTGSNNNLFGIKSATVSSKWTCDACFVTNDGGKDDCIACSTPKPGSGKKEKAFEKTSFTTSTNSNHSFGLNSNSNKEEKKPWNCTTCFVQNPASNANCQACQSMKPGNTIPPVSFGLGAFGKRPLESKDEASQNHEKKVRFTESTTDSNGKTAPMTFGLSKSNDSTNSTPAPLATGSLFGLKKPGEEEDSTEPSANKTNSTADKPSAILFGASASATTKPIIFGASNPSKDTAVSKAAAAPATIVFGANPATASTSNAATAKTDLPVPAAGTLMFGSSKPTGTDNSTTNLFGASKPTAEKSTNLFGASKPAAEKSTNLFGAPATDAGKALFAFGKKDDSVPKNALGTPDPMTPDTPGAAKPAVANTLTFGMPKSTSASGSTAATAPIFPPTVPKTSSAPLGGSLFSGATSTTSGSSTGLKFDSSGGFKFGDSSKTAPAPPSFLSATKPSSETPSFLTAPKPAAVPATFSFGKPAEQNNTQAAAPQASTGISFGNKDISLAVPGTFQFSAAAAPPAAPASNPGIIQFSSTGAPGATGARPLLKAKRKIRK